MQALHYGPQLPFSDQLHADKYRLEGENFREASSRIAGALKDDDDHFRDLLDIFRTMRFMPGGRIQNASGSPKRVTPYNCYVSGTIQDSFVDGDGSIMQRAAEAAQTMRLGGGIGYDFSTLRPSGDLIRGVMSKTDGPMAFLPIFDAVCKATSSAGNRRGAQMGVMRIDHPDIMKFIHVKNTLGVLEGFNLSIAVTDKFMEHLDTGEPFPLTFGGRVYQEVDPIALWDMVMRSTWDWAEPGVLFIDTINRKNNLYYCETIAATNPCGEQPLPPFGACLLGSFNLTKYVRRTSVINMMRTGVTGPQYEFDWELFRRDIEPVIRAMDNVIDRALYPLTQQEQEAKNKRRMGIGITGLANAGEALGHSYGCPGFIDFELEVLETLRNYSYLASANIAEKKGAFPLYDADRYLSGEFVKTLPDFVLDRIKANGMRNSHLTSIAPTGTISFCADYISSGIEPVFGFQEGDDYSYQGKRQVIMPEGTIITDVSDYGFREFGVEGRFAQNVTAAEHVDVLLAAADLMDSAVSKTINVDGSMPWAEFTNIYKTVWERGGKGCTTFNSDGKRMGILLGKESADENDGVMKTDESGEVCYIDPQTGRRECG